MLLNVTTYVVLNSGSAGWTGAEPHRERAVGPSAWGRTARGRASAHQSERGGARAGVTWESSPSAGQRSGGTSVHPEGTITARDPTQNTVHITHIYCQLITCDVTMTTASSVSQRNNTDECLIWIMLLEPPKHRQIINRNNVTWRFLL